jgi:TM2 domain-containing membrane protein YozV
MTYNGNAVLESDKSRLACLLLAIFLGFLGIHRFYVGKIGTGILWLLTGGLLGIGVLIDVILIAVGTFRDKAGRLILRW